MRKVLIIEDHPLVSESTKDLLLKIEPSLEVFIAPSAREALHVVNTEKKWHRIFMDLGIPGSFGLVLARKFKQLGVANICTIVTAYDNSEWRAEAQKMGMLGYISKDTAYNTYIKSLHSVMEGVRSFSDTEQSIENVPQLTRRQQDLLNLMKRGFSTSEIAKQLCVTEGHVNNLFQSLKKVLRANTQAHAIARAVELGYINMQDYH